MALLIGHQHILDRLVAYAGGGRLAGSWIFSGIKGIGKTRTAMMLAEKLLGENHPNLKIIKRDLTETEKKALVKLIEDGKEIDEEQEERRERKSEITVNDVRALEDFTAYRSMDGKPKIIIVDSVDEMNANAANALLKTLEEPPPDTVIILISHQMQKLLPTIRSRCKVVKFMPLNDDDIRERLNDEFGSVKDVELTVKLSEGSLGRAYDLVSGNGASLYGDMLDGMVMGKVPASVSKDNMDLAFDLIFAAIGRLIKHNAGSGDTLPAEHNAFDRLRHPVLKLMRLLNESITQYHKSKYLYLDKANVLDTVFFRLKGLK